MSFSRTRSKRSVGLARNEFNVSFSLDISTWFNSDVGCPAKLLFSSGVDPMRFALFFLVCSAMPIVAEDLAPVVKSTKSGAWSDPKTWSQFKVPSTGDRVLIQHGHHVVYDADSKAVIRGISISGTLQFSHDRNTRLEVGLLTVNSGNVYTEEGFDCEAHVEAPAENQAPPTLQIGTQAQPIAAGKSALIRLHYINGMKKESCPAIVVCGGRWDAHGQPLNRTWVKLNETVPVGATTFTLAEAVTGWKVGDRVVITGTQTHGNVKTESVAEERIIQAIDGTKITFAEPLKHSHLGDGEYRAEVANLSRNVIIESADPAGVRGHTMYHRYSSGSLSYVELRHLGKKDTLGRYAVHYHLVGDTMRGSSVLGLSVWDSHNRWVTVHGTNYLLVKDCVGYKSIGHGFFLEDGTEVYNVFHRNLAILAEAGKKLPKQVLPFDQNEGAGFWWTNSLNTFTNNVAAECDRYGFRYEATPTSALKLDFPIRQPDGKKVVTDVRTLPFVRFDDNEVHSSHGLYGVNLGEGVNRVGPDVKHPFVVRNLKIWDVHYAFRVQVPSILVENLHIHRAVYGVYHPNFDNHVYRNVYISQTNSEPFNRGHDDLSIQYGVLTVDGLTFDQCRSGGMPLIQISDDNPTGNAVTHIRQLKTTNWNDGSKAKAIANLGGGPRPQPKSERGVPIYVHDYFGQGQHAMIVSSRSPEYKKDPMAFRKESPLTGDESRVREVKDVTFPQPLQPIDDLPPTTVITKVERRNGNVYIQGIAADNGTITKVVVNGQPAKSTAKNWSEWEIELPDSDPEMKITARSEDAAGNIEKTPMQITSRR